MWSLRLALLVPLLMCALGFARTAAADDDTQLRGGNGGGSFRMQCPPGKNLVGLAMRYGEWLDSVGVYCVGVRADGRWDRSLYEIQPLSGRRAGGAGGGAEEKVICPPDHFVYAITVSKAREFVAKVELHCINDRSRDDVVVTPMPGPSGSDYQTTWPLDCRSQLGQRWAHGIFGQAGNYVDAIGLVCNGGAPPPRVAEQPANAPDQVISPQPPPKWTRKLRNGGRYATDSVAVTPPSSPPPPSPPSVPEPPAAGQQDAAYQRFEPPTTDSNARVYACLRIPDRLCGRAAARAFCSTKGFASVESFHTSVENVHAETLDGQVCENETCTVFDAIACAD